MLQRFTIHYLKTVLAGYISKIKRCVINLKQCEINSFNFLCIFNNISDIKILHWKKLFLNFLLRFLLSYSHYKCLRVWLQLIRCYSLYIYKLKKSVPSENFNSSNWSLNIDRENFKIGVWREFVILR